MVSRFARLVIVAALVITAPSGEGAAPLSPDIAIRETADGLQVFVADPNRGRLLFGVVKPGVRSVPVQALAPLTPCGAVEGAVAVAVRDARLVVAKGQPGPAVFECDLNTGKGGWTLAGEPLREPASVAIAADGSIAVLDRVLRAAVVLRPGSKPTVIRVAGSPLMMRGDDVGQVYVVDADVRGVVPIQLAEGKTSSLGSSPMAQQARPGALLPLAVEPASFAVYRDVFYVAETTGALQAQLTGSRLSIEIPDVRPRQAAVAASRSYLAMLDRETVGIEIIERPVPAGLVIDPARGNPNEAWLQMLEYVAERRLLPRDRVSVTPDDTTYEALLQRTGVLVKSDVNPQRVAIPAGRASKLFCTLNPTLCASGYNPKLSVVVIPQASPQPVLQTETTVLNGKDVRTAINERVLLSAHQKEVTEAYVTTRNPSVAPTLENELLRRKMIMATPMDPKLVAGTIIRIQNGTESVIGSIAAMCEGLAPTESKTALLSRLTAPRQVVPDPKLVTGDRAVFEVGTWTRSSISTAALERCRPADVAQDAYVITESLAVRETAVSSSTPVRTAAQSAPVLRVIEGPFYVGYKVVPMSGLVAGVAVPADPERLKPMPSSATAAIWSISSGSLTLPVTRWRTDVLLPASDLYSSDNALRRLTAQQPPLDLSPRERLDRSALSANVAAPQPPDGDLTAKIQIAHKQLVDTIHFDPALAAAAGTEDVLIGIVEQVDSVNLDHPGFVSDDQSAWLEFVPGAGTLQPRRPQAGAAPLRLRRVDKTTEHGTHVAGMIAARQQPAVGMLPKTQLFLVPSDSMDDLKRWIQTARDNFVYLFNMSLGFSPATTPDTIQDLHRRIQESWKDALFVVAAGNDGADLNATGAQAPVSWAASLPNVLTVGAADHLGENLLGQHQDGKDEEERKGSNFGAQFIDLIAPGRTVHSLGRDGYAYACGSSHAAPQVTATAAMLWPQSTKPEVVRARLIYTADWKAPNFDRKVWGGLLNVTRAVFAPKNNVYTKFGTDTTPHEIKFAPTATVRIDGDIQNRIGSPTPIQEDKFPFARVLRIESLGGGQSRIVLLSNPNGVLTIVKGTIQGTVKCQSVKRYDQKTQRFSADPDVPVNCAQGLAIGQMKDYVAAMPAAVRFQ